MSPNLIFVARARSTWRHSRTGSLICIPKNSAIPLVALLYTPKYIAEMRQDRRESTLLLFLNATRGSSKCPFVLYTCGGAPIRASVWTTHAGTEGQASTWKFRMGPRHREKKKELGRSVSLCYADPGRSHTRTGPKMQKNKK